MTQLCSRCQRANPAEANYCYFDGFVLAGHGAGGPVAVGSQAFTNAFVFPSGRSCRSFNELALGCQEEWASACKMLQEGYLETFLGGIGRIDLALAAKEASKFPDPDRGLDQVLSKLPSDTLEAPSLRCEPQEISLGIITGDKEQRFDLHLENKGMRLLHGSITTDSPWLVLGDGSVGREKHFQCTHEQTLTIRVANEFLRAGPKPIEARLSIDSNGGSAVIVVRAERPVTPYPEGLFAGAKTPRQVALTAKAQPKEAAPLFERGDVANWYKSNGWTYPVQGPASTGLGAIQQFFEALGLVPPPKVEISLTALRLEGMPGDQLTSSLELKTLEKRPVYAHAVSDQPWLVAKRAKLSGRNATIPLVVDVPDNPGEELSAKLTVQSNGNQRFVVNVRVKVGGEKLALPPRRKSAPEPVLQVVGAASSNPFAAMVSDEPAPVLSARSSAVAELPREERPSPAAVTTLAPAPDTILDTVPSGRAGMGRYRRQKKTPLVVHLFPAGVLLAAVLGVVIFDLVKTPTVASTKQDEDEIARLDREAAAAAENTKPKPSPPHSTKEIVFDLKGRKPVLNLGFSDLSTFGLTMTTVRDPNNPDKFKKIIYEESGITNNTVVRIDQAEKKFGKVTPLAFWLPQGKGPKNGRQKLPGDRVGSEHTMEFRDSGGNAGIQVRQHVELVPSEKDKVDTCLVWYTVTNTSEQEHTVGLRIMLDTYIGARDDVPFTINNELIDTHRLFKEDQIPDYIEAVENPKDPSKGEVVRMQIKGIALPGTKVEQPDQLYVGGFPGENSLWDDFLKDQKDIKEARDSCVVLYWAYRPMKPGEVRNFVFTYGLSEMVLPRGEPPPVGQPAEKAETLMALRSPAFVEPNSEFLLTGYVWNGEKNQKVSIHLPSGVELVPGESADKLLARTGSDRQVVTWKVRAGKAETYSIEATTRKASDNKDIKARRDVVVKQNSIFG